jgi:hypothetical protein
VLQGRVLSHENQPKFPEILQKYCSHWYFASFNVVANSMNTTSVLLTFLVDSVRLQYSTALRQQLHCRHASNVQSLKMSAHGLSFAMQHIHDVQKLADQEDTFAITAMHQVHAMWGAA